jgi:lipid-A-disaccharide synthase-like uncharacterized protein
LSTNDYPIVPALFWTVAIWGALTASVLLLFRSRSATPVAGGILLLTLGLLRKC